jgi:hypothetical protein
VGIDRQLFFFVFLKKYKTLLKVFQRNSVDHNYICALCYDVVCNCLYAEPVLIKLKFGLSFL